MTFQITEFKTLFINDTEEQLQNLNTSLLLLEKNPQQKEILNDLMRFLHNIKGTSASVGFEQMSSFAHTLEDILDAARHDQIVLTSQDIQIFFEAIDILSKSLENIRITNNELILKNETEKLERFKTKLLSYKNNGQIKDPQEVTTITSEQKNIESKDKDIPKAHVISQNIQHKTESIGVPVERLDRLIDISGSLLTLQATLEKIIEKKDKNLPSLMYEIEDIYHEFSSLIKDLQYQVLEARLIPLEYIFKNFPRFIRDIARKEKKEVTLEINGADIELDRSVIDKIGDPLIHLLKNALDHGIKEKGTIAINAWRKNSSVFIEVKDNGEGLNFNAILETALNNKIISEKKATELKKEIPQENTKFISPAWKELITQPMISTSEKISAISGRGAGLNSVKKFVDSIGGSLHIQKLSKGTGFLLELPLTIALIKTLAVGIGKHVYLIPLLNIQKSLFFDSKIKNEIKKYNAILFQKNKIKVVNLSKFFNNETAFSPNPSYLIIIKIDDTFIALGVDEIIAQQDTLVKKFPTIGQEKKIFAGATILNTGEIALILDLYNIKKEIYPSSIYVSS